MRQNEASAQGLQNALYNECHTKFLTKLWTFENRKFVWWLYVARVHRKIQYKNLPAPTDLTENPYGKKKLFFKDATQKSARVVAPEIAVEVPAVKYYNR